MTEQFTRSHKSRPDRQVRRVSVMFPGRNLEQDQNTDSVSTQPAQELTEVDIQDLLLLSNEELAQYGYLDRVNKYRAQQSQQPPLTIERTVTRTETEKVTIDPRAASLFGAGVLNSVFASQQRPQLAAAPSSSDWGEQDAQGVAQTDPHYFQDATEGTEWQSEQGAGSGYQQDSNWQNIISPKKKREIQPSESFWDKHPKLRKALGETPKKVAVRTATIAAIVGMTAITIDDAVEAGGAMKRQEVGVAGAALALLPLVGLPGASESSEQSTEANPVVETSIEPGVVNNE